MCSCSTPPPPAQGVRREGREEEMRAGEEIPLFVHPYDQAQPGPPRPRAGVVPSRTSRRRRRGRTWASGHYDQDQPGLRLLDLASASSPAGPRADVMAKVLTPAPPFPRSSRRLLPLARWVSQMRGSTKKTHMTIIPVLTKLKFF
jgi:hypothetical protein